MADKERRQLLLVVKADVVPGVTDEEVVDVVNYKLDTGVAVTDHDPPYDGIEFASVVDVTQPGTFREDS